MRDLCDVLNLRMDENGVWSCHYGTPSQPQAARQRAIFVGYELATKGETRSSVLAKQLNINRKTAYKMLCNLSLVLPIYYDEHSRTWKVLDMRELD